MHKNIDEKVLPSTRLDLLKDVLRYRFFDLVYASLYVAIFSLPALFWILFVNTSTLAEFDNIYSPLVVYSVLALLIGFIGPGFGGAFHFFKKLVFSEGANVHKDFFNGVRMHYKFTFKSFLFIGVLYGLVKFSRVLLSFSPISSSTAALIILVVMYIAFFFALVAVLFAIAQTILYEGRFLLLFLNGFKFIIGDFLKAGPVSLLFIIPFLIYEFVPSIIAEWIIIAAAAIFYFGFTVLCFTLYAHSVFDRTINLRQYPPLIRKGLHKERENN